MSADLSAGFMYLGETASLTQSRTRTSGTTEIRCDGSSGCTARQMRSPGSPMCRCGRAATRTCGSGARGHRPRSTVLRHLIEAGNAEALQVAVTEFDYRAAQSQEAQDYQL